MNYRRWRLRYSLEMDKLRRDWYVVLGCFCWRHQLPPHFHYNYLSGSCFTKTASIIKDLTGMSLHRNQSIPSTSPTPSFFNHKIVSLAGFNWMVLVVHMYQIQVLIRFSLQLPFTPNIHSTFAPSDIVKTCLSAFMYSFCFCMYF